MKFVGGEEEDRTPDLRIANATLSQLSYPPNIRRSYTSRDEDGKPPPKKFFAGDSGGLAGDLYHPSPPAVQDGEPASTHLTTAFTSASLMPGWAGIGITPHTPEPPSRTFFSSLAAAPGSFL